MVTGSPPPETLQASRPRKRRVWPWAAGSILIPLVVIVTTLLGARFVSRARLAAMVAPAPALPPLRVAAVIQPPAGVALWALTSAGGHPLALAYNTQAPSACIPDLACPSVRFANQFAIYDGYTGSPLLTRAITPANLSQCALLTNGAPTFAYLVCPGQVQQVSLSTGQTARHFSLPAGLDTAHAALDTATNTLYVTGAVTGAGALYAFDLKTGAQVARQPLSGPASAPIVEAGQKHVLVLINGGDAQPTLLAFRLRTLRPIGAETLLPGWRAGPRDSTSEQLYLYRLDGAVGSIDMSQLALALSQPYPAAALTTLTPLSGARALGWDSNHQTLVALYGDHVTAYDAESLQPYASLPISGVWDAQRPLPVDDSAGEVYAPDASGAIVALTLARPSAIPAPDAATALVMARAGLGALLPDTNQTPPFLSSQTFPVSVTTIARTFAIHYSDLGWRGPYPGHASAKVIKAGKQQGDYIITFAVDWNQLFVRTHSWTVELLPDGRVRMLTDTGDAIP